MILSVFLGIDIGTTAIKLGVIQESKLLYSSDLPLQTYGDDRIKYQDGNELLAILQAGIYHVFQERKQNGNIVFLEAFRFDAVKRTARNHQA